jgi:putative serine protease PepD
MASMRGRRQRRRGHGIGWHAVLATVIAAAVAACGSGGAGTQAGPANPAQQDYVRVVKELLPSVVQIDAGQQTGSGVVFDSAGDIVTNAHVVGHARTVEVFVSATSGPLTAHLVGRFLPDDLAVVRVTAHRSALRPARWANSDQAQVGQFVLAMGAPYGLIDSVTQGIVSATGRTVTGPTITGQPPMVITDAVQTSAAINPGNSGGALVLLSGAVLGIPTLAAKDPALGHDVSGIGFAIPSNTVRDIASQLIRAGHVTRSDRASLQITGSTYASKSGSGTGVSVDFALRAGAARAAGIRAGDVITGLGRTKTSDLAELDYQLIYYRPGEKAAVHVLRDGRPKVFTVRLGSLGG